MIRAVIDTNVLFEGLTNSKGACQLILEAWQAELFAPCISLALYYEYHDVLSRKLSKRGWKHIQPAFETLIASSTLVEPYYQWRPSSSDPADEFLVDCALNAKAWIVTRNVRDFLIAKYEFGLIVLTPEEFILEVVNADEDG